MKITKSMAAVALTAFAMASAQGLVVSLDFEGLQHFEGVQNYYNGGFGSLLSGPGPSYGITFTPTSLALIDFEAGGTGNIGGEPSPSTVVFFVDGPAVGLNVPGGFDTGFSFFYTAINFPGSISVYSGLNSTGDLLATLGLPVTPSDGGDPTGAFSPFFPVGVLFSGIARSVNFGGAAEQIVFDNITFGTSTPAGAEVPEAGTAAAGAFLLLLGLGAYRKSRQARR